MSNGSAEVATPKNILEVLTLRDFFAGMALQGVWASCAGIEGEEIPKYNEIAEAAYVQADSMLQARQTSS